MVARGLGATVGMPLSSVHGEGGFVPGSRGQQDDAGAMCCLRRRGRGDGGGEQRRSQRRWFRVAGRSVPGLSPLSLDRPTRWSQGLSAFERRRNIT